MGKGKGKKMNFGGFNMNNMLKQAQDMQNKLMQSQEELENQIYTGTAGGEMVKVEVTGKYEVKTLKIEKEAVDPDDVEMLQDLLLAALNDAINKAKKSSEDEMSKLTGGLNIPGLI